MAKNNSIQEVRDELGTALRVFIRSAIPPLVAHLSETGRSPNSLELNSLVERLCPTPEYHRVAELYQNNRVLQERERLGYTLDPEGWSRDKFLVSGVRRVLTESKDNSDLEQVLSQTIDAYLGLAEGRARGMTLLAPLPGLILEGQRIELDEWTVLRELASAEVERAYSGFFDRWNTPVAGVAISTRSERMSNIQDVFPVFTQELVERLRATVAFVQARIDDEIRPDWFMILNDRWWPNWLGSLQILAESRHLYPHEPIWGRRKNPAKPVTPETAVSLVEKWKGFGKAMQSPRFRRAAARFSTSIHRDSDEDAILDQCIAFECLLSSGGGGITETIATRFAILVGDTLDRRKGLRAKLKALYAVRSGIVHGVGLESRLREMSGAFASWNPPKQLSLGVAALYGKHLLGMALNRLAENPQFMEKLDELVLSGYTPDKQALVKLLFGGSEKQKT